MFEPFRKYKLRVALAFCSPLLVVNLTHCDADMQVKMLAKDIYSQHFRAAQAVPRGVVAKLYAVVKQLEAACEKHSCQV